MITNNNRRETYLLDDFVSAARTGNLRAKRDVLWLATSNIVLKYQ
jgi:hypothetical protein